MKVLGLSGYARSGKDTAAQILVDQFGYERRAFADILRQGLYALNPMLAYKGEYFPLAELVDWHGWEDLKVHAPQIRELLQRLGTEVGRNLLGPDVWVEAAFRDLDPDGSYVFTDCRFLNEARAVVVNGGKVVRIRRPGFGPANSHISEVGLDDWDFDAVIDNDRDLEYLADEVAGVLLGFDVLAGV